MDNLYFNERESKMSTKKKGRLYSGGKSILHVKYSSGGFCKTKQTRRLGIGCEYYDTEKKTCSLKKKLCMDSLHCVLYKKKK